MKALLLNFAHEEERKELTHCLQRLGCTTTLNGDEDKDVNMVIASRLNSLGEVSPYVHSLCHLLVQRHPLLPDELRQLEKLVGEAGVKLQFSDAKLYEWRIGDVAQLVGAVKLAQLYRDREGDVEQSAADLRTETLAVASVVKAKLSRVEKLRSTAACRSLLGFRTDFVNAASAYFWLSGTVFSERHELRFFGSRGVAVVDVLRREANVRMFDGKTLSLPFLSEGESREREVADFVARLRSKGQPAVSAAEMAVQREILRYLNFL
ncbi:MAG: hypothetical protein LBH84_08010 [Prevotellaceae bacterium]|nr:hypothetical protein [Prevotellaceae bacterium]